MKIEYIYNMIKNYLALKQPSREETLTATLLLYFTGIEELNILNIETGYKIDEILGSQNNELEARNLIESKFSLFEESYLKSKFHHQLKNLAINFNINSNETQAIISLFVLKQLNEKATRLPIYKESIFDKSRWGERIWDSKQILNLAFLDKCISETLFDDSKLIKSSLITDASFGRYLISKELFNYLLLPDDYSFNDLLKLETFNPSATYPLESFKNITATSGDIELMSSLLSRSNKPVAIAIVGITGLGKTELAKSLSINSGKDAFILPATKAGQNRQLNNRRGQLFLASQALNHNQILIVDECDLLIATDEFRFFQNESQLGAKEIINEILDKRKTNIIFVANENGAHNSFFRRCNYVCWINKTIKKSIPSFLTREATKYNLDFSSDELKKVDRYYGINPGVISNAISDAVDISYSKDEAKEIFFKILDSRFSNNKRDTISLMPEKDSK